MKLIDFTNWLRDTMLRMLPHRAPTGLIRIGEPCRDSPVLLTGNFTLTVRRLMKVLKGRDAWLLCANSQGINVWCAAGGGHLTHHDVISVLRTSRIGEQVEIQNLSPDPLDLAGFRLSNGVESEALTGIIPGDGLLVVVVSTLVLDPLGGTLTLLPPDGSDLVIDAVSWGTEGGAPAVPTGFTIQRVDGTDA